MKMEFCVCFFFCLPARQRGGNGGRAGRRRCPPLPPLITRTPFPRLLCLPCFFVLPCPLPACDEQKKEKRKKETAEPTKTKHKTSTHPLTLPAACCPPPAPPQTRCRTSHKPARARTKWTGTRSRRGPRRRASRGKSTTRPGRLRWRAAGPAGRGRWQREQTRTPGERPGRCDRAACAARRA